MFIKKVERPRTMTLPDGRIISVADLPNRATQRWVASRKEIVVRAVQGGMISKDSAISKYNLSEEEFDSWELALGLFGAKGLKATKVRDYRQP